MYSDKITQWKTLFYINRVHDENQHQEIMEYFMQSDTDDIRTAEGYFDGEYEEEPLR